MSHVLSPEPEPARIPGSYSITPAELGNNLPLPSGPSPQASSFYRNSPNRVFAARSKSPSSSSDESTARISSANKGKGRDSGDSNARSRFPTPPPLNNRQQQTSSATPSASFRQREDVAMAVDRRSESPTDEFIMQEISQMMNFVSETRQRIARGTAAVTSPQVASLENRSEDLNRSLEPVNTQPGLRGGTDAVTSNYLATPRPLLVSESRRSVPSVTRLDSLRPQQRRVGVAGCTSALASQLAWAGDASPNVSRPPSRPSGSQNVHTYSEHPPLIGLYNYVSSPTRGITSPSPSRSQARSSRPAAPQSPQEETRHTELLNTNTRPAWSNLRLTGNHTAATLHTAVGSPHSFSERGARRSPASPLPHAARSPVVSPPNAGLPSFVEPSGTEVTGAMSSNGGGDARIQEPHICPGAVEFATILGSLNELKATMHAIRKAQDQAAESSDEDEDELPRQKSARRNSKKRPSTVSHRAMMKQVRTAMQNMLNIRVDDDIINVVEQVLVTNREILDFQSGEISPSLQPLRVNLLDLQCPWNLQVSRLFAEQLEIPVQYSWLPQDISAHFMKRIHRLQRKLRESLPLSHNETPQQISERLESRYTALKRSKRVRKRQASLFDTRKAITEAGSNGGTNGPWTALFSMITKLGVEGMSSDESDVESAGHNVHTKIWRSRQVVSLLQFIDSNRRTTNEYGNMIGGARPHERRRDRRPQPSKRGAPHFLPRNFYDETWLGLEGLLVEEALCPGAVFSLPVIELPRASEGRLVLA